jgi:hypothetical protein
VGLKAKLPKCEFGATNIHCLGFRLTPEGILPGTDKLKAVKMQEYQEMSKKSDSSQTYATFSKAISKTLLKLQLQSKQSKWKKAACQKKLKIPFNK